MVVRVFGRVDVVAGGAIDIVTGVGLARYAEKLTSLLRHADDLAPQPPPIPKKVDNIADLADAKRDKHCFVAGTIVATAQGPAPIETICVGDRVLTNNPIAEWTEVDSVTWRKITLRAVSDESASDIIDVELLRPVQWLEAVGCTVGAQIWIELEGMGLRAWGSVVDMAPCPAIRAGHGRVVLATVTHLNTAVVQVRLAGFADPLEPTSLHRLFSVTRNNWVPAGELTEGEVLLTRLGTARIESVLPKPGIHRVYNLEVEAEHCFYAGDLQVLSHNDCTDGYSEADALSRMEGEGGPSLPEASESRTNWGPEHGRGNIEHNNAIEDTLDAAERRGATDLAKDLPQRDVSGDRVFAPNGKFTKPDAAWTEGGVRYNHNRVSNLDRLERELKAFNKMIKADPNAVNSLEF